MKKRLMLALMLILCAALLCSCGDKKKYDVGTAQNQGNQQTQQNLGDQPAAPAQEDEIDPLAEEDDYTGDAEYWGESLPTQVPAEVTPAPTVRSEYAGATPVVIDPIDKPTPTPVPPLTVAEYVTYDATNIGMSFDGPAGWSQAEGANEFTIQNPNARIDYPATLTLRAEKVASDYTNSELKTIINGMLDAIETVGFEDYEPSQTANRDLLGTSGVYANYTGTLLDGRQVAGRVHAVCVDKKLYTIHLSAPQAQWNDYKEMVYDKLRDTLTIVK